MISLKDFLQILQRSHKDISGLVVVFPLEFEVFDISKDIKVPLGEYVQVVSFDTVDSYLQFVFHNGSLNKVMKVSKERIAKLG